MTTSSSRSRKIRVGVFAACSLALVAVVLIVFGGMRFWAEKDSYYVDIDGGVVGLETGANVMFNGIRVGTVKSMKIPEDNLRQVRLRIEIDADRPIHHDTHAMLRFLGVTGVKIVDLKGGTAGSPELPPGSTIQTGETTLDEVERRGMEVLRKSSELMAKANDVMAKSELFVDNLVEISDPAKYEGIRKIVDNARAATASLAATSQTLDAMVAENRAALRSSLAAIDRASLGVEGVVADVHGFVADLTGVVNANETQLQSAMNDVRQATRSFRDLARDLKARPSRLLFSKAPKDRMLP